MPIPSIYTEQELALFMLDDLGDVGTALSLSLESMTEAVNDALVAYGVQDIAQATHIARLRALARVAAWRRAVVAASVLYDFQANDGRFSRSQLYKQASDGYARAQSDAAAVSGGLPGYVVSRRKFSIAPDPYTRKSDEYSQADA